MSQFYDYRASGTFSTGALASAALIASGSAGASSVIGNDINDVSLDDARSATYYYGFNPNTATGGVNLLVDRLIDRTCIDAGDIVIAFSMARQNSDKKRMNASMGKEAIQQRLSAMANSEWFKKTYEGRSIAPVVYVDL